MNTEKVELGKVTATANYIESVFNLVYDADEYIKIFRKNVPELYRLYKNGTCKSEAVDEASVFLLSEADHILCSKCNQFASDAQKLVSRKYKEVNEYLHKSRIFSDSDTVKISHDIITYYSDYQQRLDWDYLSSGHYGDHKYDGLNIYNLTAYAKKRRHDLEKVKFNNIIDYNYTILVDTVDFGYRESINTFIKLRRLLDASDSLYSSLSIIHVFIDILLMMCYFIEYIYEETDAYPGK